MIEFAVLGGARLMGGDPERLAGLLAQPKRVGLLAYVTLARPRGFQSRDTLLALFWPELDGRHARWALNQAVRYLRRALGESAVLRRGDDVAVDVAHVQCDAIALEAACAAGQWDEAMRLYGGELLPGLRPGGAAELDHWLDTERERLLRLAGGAASARTEELLAAGDMKGATDLARKATQLAPDDETRVRRLIELLDAAGDRAGAARAYDAYAAWLRTERELEPSPETQAIIAKVRARRGDRQARVAETEIGATASAAPARAGDAPQRGARFVLAVLVLAAVLGGAWWGVSRFVGRAPPIRSLVVLPLENLSRDPEKEYFVEGIHDALIGELGQITGLRVISRSSAMSYKGSGKRVPEIARELGVDAVVEGTVFPAGDSVRIQVELIGARPERHLWAGAYHRDLRNAVSVLGEVAGRIAEQVEVALTPQQRARLAASRPAEPAAQDLVLHGVSVMDIRDPRRVVAAIQAFRQAIAIDPRYALAYARLAAGYTTALSFWFAPADSGYTWAGRALAAADRAIVLDPAQAYAYASRSALELWAGAPTDLVERDMLHAIALNPSAPRVQRDYAYHLATRGRVQESYEVMQRAIELDPLTPGTAVVEANVARIADDWGRVLRIAHRGRGLHPDVRELWMFEGLALRILGRPAECLALERVPDGIKATCLHAVGRTAEAERLIRRVADGWNRGDVGSPPYYLVWYYALAGQLGEAIRWTERAFDRTPVGYAPLGLPRGELGPVLDMQGGRFRATVERLRRQAWERVLAESRRMTLP